ncbi:MAG: hypothetical protein AMS22_06325 [Thiotrichales bacterium SG8_50]|nr:MAG: hypothetical protein AMS22_06325 [Thiotrichales bacterium SG8_50]
MKYRVVKITNNVDRYPECADDTAKYPDLVQHVEDEMELFIISADTGRFWPAGDFFYMTDVDFFTTGETKCDCLCGCCR